MCIEYIQHIDCFVHVRYVHLYSSAGLKTSDKNETTNATDTLIDWRNRVVLCFVMALGIFTMITPIMFRILSTYAYDYQSELIDGLVNNFSKPKIVGIGFSVQKPLSAMTNCFVDDKVYQSLSPNYPLIFIRRVKCTRWIDREMLSRYQLSNFFGFSETDSYQ